MEPYTVQAEYSFQRQNNDELQFKKGDIITVTQCEDGGWWEGTLGDMTGWFPSNYVKEYKAPAVPTETVPDIQANRSVVLDDLLESEKAHVAEIRGLLENFLEPLASSQLLTGDEYAQLMSNFVEVVQTHEELLTSLEDCNDRVGKLFLSKATLMKNVHQAYCAAHPRAIVILDKYKDELETFMEERGAAKPGLLVLTTGLSKAFRRLDKYSAMLQELERHMESGHPDRGNTQRSVAVYKDIASVCSATRRQKELELQVLTGPVRGWQGQELSTLGDIIHMGSVAVGPEHRDRYFVLFPQTLLILSVSQRMSAFIYEGKLPLTGITVSRLEDTDSIKNAFEVSGPLIEKIVAVCQGPNEANKWVDLISAHPGAVRQQTSDEAKRNTTSAVNITQPPVQSHHQGLGTSQPNNVTTPPPPQHKRSLSFNHHLSYNQFQSHQSNKHPVNQDRIPHSAGLNGRNVNNIKDGCWQITNLRPAPPLRPSTSNSNSASSGALSSYSRKPQPTHEEDALVLRVFEAYCAAYQNTSRNTMHSVLQPWTPCLPIRGGKLKTSRYHSTSNPQLPFMCSSSSFVNNQKNTSSGSLNSSYIWREASPNNFNMYSASVSSLNTSYRYSFGPNTCSPEWRSHDEKMQNKRSFMSQFPKCKTSSNYENVNYMAPLLPARKHKNPNIKIVKQSDSMHSPRCGFGGGGGGGLYDRRVNRSFESAPQEQRKTGPLRRSTPHLAGRDDVRPQESAGSSSRHSATWCCGNFVLKQWRKMNNFDY